MPKPLTASERLALLLPWINGDRVSDRDLRRRIKAFIASFDGSAAAGYVQTLAFAGVKREPWIPAFIKREPPRATEPVDETDLEILQNTLEDLLRRGFPYDPRYPEPTYGWVVNYPSLGFGVRGTHRRSPGRLSQVGTTARRNYLSPGAYTLLVDGVLGDLVPFLVLHLLTGPRMATITRCRAPAPRHWDRRCGRFVLGIGRGRPREFCSNTCRVRHHAEALRKEDEQWHKKQGTRKFRRKK